MGEKSCYKCKFFDGVCCMYNCACKAILDSIESSENCNHHEIGDYNQDELEKTNYK